MLFRLCCIGLLFSALGLQAAPSAGIDAAQLLAFGQSGPRTSGSLQARYEAARTALTSDPLLRTQTKLKAEMDAFGATRTHSAHDDALTYTEIMREHLAWLANHAETYTQVIQRAYREVINREAYPEEIRYWNEQPNTLSYIMLVACVEDWARRNQPGLMVTGGKPTVSINCEFLATARLTPAEAATARALAFLPDVTAPGNHVVAVGAAHLASSGGIHFIAAGASHVSLQAGTTAAQP